MGIILRPERMIDGAGGPPRHQVSVLVEDGQISGVETNDIAGDHKVIDLPGATLLPGLIDTHVHLTVGHSPWDYRTYLASSLEQQLIYAIENGRRSLEAGITTMRDCGGRKEVLLPLRDEIRAGTVRGPRLLVAGPPVTTTAGHMWYFGLEADTEDELRRSVRQLIKDGVDYIKIAASGGGMTPNSNPRDPQYTAGELRIINQEAARLGKMMTAHCLATESVRRGAEAGLPMIEHAAFFRDSAGAGTVDFIAENGFDYQPEITEEIVRNDIPVSQAIIGWHRSLHHSPERFEPDQRAMLESELEDRRAHLHDMRQRGVRFLAGSDGMGDIPREYFATLELSARDIGLSAMETIVHATSLPAQIMGIGEETGTISPGMSADLLAIDGNPLENIAHLRRTRMVMFSGEIIVHRRGTR